MSVPSTGQSCQLSMAFLKFLLMGSVDEHESNCHLLMVFLKFLLLGSVEHKYNCHLSMAFLKFLLMGSVDKHECNCHLSMAFLKLLLMDSVEHECNPHRPKLSLVKGFLFFDCEDRSFIVLKKWALTPNKYTETEAQKQKLHGMSRYMHYVNWMVLSPPVEKNKNMHT